MYHLRNALTFLAVLVLIGVVSALPRPQDEKNEIDNAIPQGTLLLDEPTKISAISTSSTTTPTPNRVHITRAPPTPSSAFSDFFTNIFQIPINVLRSVGNFLGGVFNRQRT